MYCFPCYLFAQDTQASKQFFNEGVASWNKINEKDYKLAKHVGKHTSVHSLHFTAWNSLPINIFLIEDRLDHQSEQQKADHRLWLTVSVKTMQNWHIKVLHSVVMTSLKIHSIEKIFLIY